MADFVGPDASMPILRSRVHGEQADRFQLLGDGTILKGDGSGSLSVEGVGGWFDVTRGPYNAKGDGTSNDRAAIEAAIAAAVATISASGKGAVVYLPPGVFYLGSQSGRAPINPSTGDPYGPQIGVPLPVGLPAKLTIRGAGRGVTTIKLSDNARNVFWIDQKADYDTFQNVTLEDFDVDNNNALGRCHVVIGNRPAANTPQRRLNFQDINVRRIRAYNIPVDLTQTTSYKCSVQLLGAHPVALEATQTFSKRITVEDVEMFGGDNGINVCSYGNSSGGTNHFYDEIHFRRCRHEIASTPTQTAGQTSFFICGSGFGGYCSIVDCYSKNIADDGIEVGSMQRTLIERYRCDDPFLTGILFRATHAPLDVATQEFVVRDVEVNLSSAYSAISGVTGFPVNWQVDNGQPFGTFRFQNLTYSSDGIVWSVRQTVDVGIRMTAPILACHFDGLNINVTNFNFDRTTGTNNLTMLRLNNQTVNAVVKVRNLRLRFNGWTATAGANVNFYPVYLSGVQSHIIIDGFEIDNGTYTSSGGGVWLLRAGDEGNLRLTLRGMAPLNSQASITGVAHRCIGIGSAGNLVKCSIERCNFNAWNGASVTEVELTTAGTNAPRVVVDEQTVAKDGTILGLRKATAANLTMTSVDKKVAVTNTTAARTITLPAASAVPPGQVYTVKDESGGAATNNITVQRAGSDTIEGATSVVINTNYGQAKLYSTGSAWVAA